MAARAFVAVAAGATVLLVADARDAGSAPRDGRLLVVSGGAIRATSAVRARPTRLVRGASPAWSPDGTRFAFSHGGDLWLANADGSGVLRLTDTPTRQDGDPAWSPDGRTLAFSSRRTLADGTPDVELWTIGTSGRDARRLASSTGDDREPAWSPDGRSIAFVSSREGDDEIYVAPASGRGAVRVTSSPGEDASPAWSPDGTRLAFASRRDGNWEIYVIEADGSNPANVTGHQADDISPTWSPSGTRLAFSSERDGGAAVFLANADGSGPVRLTAGTQPDWQLVPTARELLPDLDQRAPRDLSVVSSGGHTFLVFSSAVDNVGEGPVWIRSRRDRRVPTTMVADQLVSLSTGGAHVHRDVGRVRYTPAPTHTHWHLLRFAQYELRRAADFALAARDRKTGFCLADHFPRPAHRVRLAPSRFRGNCGAGRPRLRSLEQGSSVGWTDWYPPSFHGQHVEITHVRPGRYVLVHRANPDNRLRERSYANNAASALVQIGRGRVEVLAVCEGRERCSAARGRERGSVQPRSRFGPDLVVVPR